MKSEAQSKTCKKCDSPKPIGAFGRNAMFSNIGAKDGLHVYCKECVNKGKRDRWAAQRALRPPKPPKPEPLDTFDQVEDSIRRGNHTRKEIKQDTELSWDDVTESLAVLKFDRETISVRRVEGEPCSL